MRTQFPSAERPASGYHENPHRTPYGQTDVSAQNQGIQPEACKDVRSGRGMPSRISGSLQHSQIIASLSESSFCTLLAGCARTRTGSEAGVWELGGGSGLVTLL